MNFFASGPLPINFTDYSEDRKKNISVNQIDSKLSNGFWAVRCDNVFSQEECQKIIEVTVLPT